MAIVMVVMFGCAFLGVAISHRMACDPGLAAGRRKYLSVLRIQVV